MSKKNGKLSKSSVIREYLKNFPNKSAAEIVAELKKKSVVVTPQLVYNIKASGGNKKSSRKNKTKKATSGLSDSYSRLTAAKGFLVACDNNYDEAVDLLGKLKSLLD